MAWGDLNCRLYFTPACGNAMRSSKPNHPARWHKTRGRGGTCEGMEPARSSSQGLSQGMSPPGAVSPSPMRGIHPVFLATSSTQQRAERPLTYPPGSFLTYGLCGEDADLCGRVQRHLLPVDEHPCGEAAGAGQHLDAPYARHVELKEGGVAGNHLNEKAEGYRSTNERERLCAHCMTRRTEQLISVATISRKGRAL